MNVTIEEAKWRHAGKDITEFGYTGLLNDKGQMCCLGFCCIALGCDESMILGKLSPVDVKDSRLEGVLTSLNADNAFSNEAMRINDGYYLEDRKEKLIELFKKHGHNLTFVP